MIGIKKFWEEDNRNLDTELKEDTPFIKDVEGRIYHLNRDKGYGFIEATNRDEMKFERVYFFWTDLIEDTLKFLELEINIKVKFNAFKGEKSWKAQKVEVISESK